MTQLSQDQPANATKVHARILVVQRRLTHYRVAFFETLRAQLAANDLELVLAYGDGTTVEQDKNDGADLNWGHKLATRYFMGGRICFQPLGHLVEGKVMLVITPENKLVCNLWHQFGAGPYKVGLWGHGANLQGNAASWRERFKRIVARKADWWFGYTALSKPLIAKCGFPKERVTVLENTIDTTQMRLQFEAVDTLAITHWRDAHAMHTGPVGIYLGSLYEEKRIDFLLRAATRIHAQVPNFQLLMVGAGPQASLVNAFCKVNSWARFTGILTGVDKVTALACATVMLNPGAVGLGILDSFVCEVPMLTTDCGLHGPEIAYLQSGQNGVLTNNTLDDYVTGVVALLGDARMFAKLKIGCAVSAKQYTVENMAINFAEGVMNCLAAPGYRSVVTK